MSTKTEASPKPKLARTDYAICVCTNEQHAAVHHRRHASPTRPRAEIVQTYPTGHVVERQIAWTPWKAKA